MNKIALVAIVSAVLAASHAVPTFAQGPRRWLPRAGQPNNVYRPMPGAPSSFPPPQSRVMVDARGNRFVAAQPYGTRWDPRQGSWVLGRTSNYGAQGMSPFRPLVDPRVYQAQGAIQAHSTTHPGFGAPRGTNQIGVSAGTGMNQSRQHIHDDIGAPRGTGQLGQGSNANTAQIQPQSGSPPVVTPTTMSQPTAMSQPATTGYPPQGTVTAGAGAGSQPLYAANLGIYYQPVRYDNGTFGARLVSAPVPGSPASSLPLDVNDVIFALADKRFTNSGDLINHFNVTTVSYVDSATNTSQSGTITLPPPGP